MKNSKIIHFDADLTFYRAYVTTTSDSHWKSENIALRLSVSCFTKRTYSNLIKCVQSSNVPKF